MCRYVQSLDEVRQDFVSDVASFVTEEVIPMNPDGFTLDLWSMTQPSFQEKVYIVSLRGCSWVGEKTPTRPLLGIWLLAHFSYFEVPNHYVGAWVDPKGEFHLDVSIAVREEAAATERAQQEGQRCIYHPSSDREIWVPQIDREAA